MIPFLSKWSVLAAVREDTECIVCPYSGPALCLEKHHNPFSSP
jgi:hypothetical protein